jgi:hypothetical protein
MVVRHWLSWSIYVCGKDLRPYVWYDLYLRIVFTSYMMSSYLSYLCMWYLVFLFLMFVWWRVRYRGSVDPSVCVCICIPKQISNMHTSRGSPIYILHVLVAPISVISCKYLCYHQTPKRGRLKEHFPPLVGFECLVSTQDRFYVCWRPQVIKFVTHIDIGFRKEELAASQVFTRQPEVPTAVAGTTGWILGGATISRMDNQGGRNLGWYLASSTGPRYYCPTFGTFLKLSFWALEGYCESEGTSENWRYYRPTTGPTIYARPQNLAGTSGLSCRNYMLYNKISATVKSHCLSI